MRKEGGTRRPSGALLVLAGLAAPAAGQDVAELHGRVLADSSLAAIPGAVVSAGDLEVVTLSGPGGSFLLLGVPPGEVPVRVEADGYAVLTATLDVAPGQALEVTFELQPLAAVLDEILVLAGRNREEGVAVDRFDSLRIAEESAAGAGASELMARVPGATVLQGGSQPGSGFRILLRGLNSLSGSNHPTVYVDGVRLTSGQAGALVAGVPDRGSLDFLDPDDIARVEVVKGPAASARFGMEAAAGVILIYTRTGGPPPG